jgi:hypothetical protein
LRLALNAGACLSAAQEGLLTTGEPLSLNLSPEGRGEKLTL